MKYVGTLWDEDKLRRRVESLFEIEDKMGVMFRTFFTYLPSKPPVHPSARTFIVLPKASSPFISHFLQAPNTLAGDETEAHTGMFDGKTNDGYYELGLLTAQLIREVMFDSRNKLTEDESNVTRHRSAEDSAKPADSTPADAASEQLVDITS
ncbi:hypothetical protein PHLCEN_2v1641 [Hermanssonia centrifuga]|uniref:Uncharacterized protein n=1 Tax=Hermanssonia centrifuga TaxID=98765 RepID=A0A2R6RZP7_9APHY|nr:hypothetical protein PHLCEN_2v1641 [Hermanssonia centrifuga]